MANLTFRSIKSSGSEAFKGDFYFENIDLSGFVDLPALLLMATKGVDYENNFITINADQSKVGIQSYAQAQSESYFVGRILSNPTSTWITQTAHITSGKLKPANNILGIHTRKADGTVYFGDLGPHSFQSENISIARIFLFHFGSQ